MGDDEVRQVEVQAEPAWRARVERLKERPILAWKALLLEKWMRDRNFRADHAEPERKNWPKPEGDAAALEAGPLSIDRTTLFGPTATAG